LLLAACCLLQAAGRLRHSGSGACALVLCAGLRAMTSGVVA
jgi:hypothetical protein